MEEPRRRQSSNVNIVQFQEDHQSQGMEKIYIILFVREAQLSYLRMNTRRVGLLKKCN